MTQLSPYVLRTAMMLEELEYESQRAAYMVISDMHRLQGMANADERKNPPQNNSIMETHGTQGKNKKG